MIANKLAKWLATVYSSKEPILSQYDAFIFFNIGEILIY